jgi:hypothetical protein
MGYKEDLASALKRQSDIITQQVFLEVIKIVCECETYDEFRKRMYGIALGYIKELEEAGIMPETANTKTDTTDDGILI